MATLNQIAANRRNALKSTGPTSAAGKAASSMNALKTGIHARSCIIRGESIEELHQLIDEYYARHRPDSPEVRALVDDIVMCEWELRRLSQAESQMWNHQMEDSWTKTKHPVGKVAASSPKSHAALQRRLDATRRGRDRAIRLLHELRRNPIPVPETAAEDIQAAPQSTTSSEIGFVPATPAQPLCDPALPLQSERETHPEVVLS